MSRTRLLAAGLVAALVGSMAAEAGADTPPSSWDVAKDPGARERWTLHVRVERLLFPPRDDEGVADPRLDMELRMEAARSMLEAADAAHSSDPRLRFDLGTVYYELGDRQGGRLDLFQKAVDVLAPAIDAFPESPASTSAMVELVYAYAKMNRPREELATWQRYIPRLMDDRARITAMMNMGEAEMRLGRIDDARATFREVLRICGELPNSSGVGSTYVLALFDLAVALDRSGDPRGALETASKAARMAVISSSMNATTGAWLIAHDRNVFFVPEWEREWYLALVAGAAAREATDPRDSAAMWGEAETHWGRYVDRSTAAGGADAWLPIAKVRRDRAHTDRLAAEKRGSKLPRRVRAPRPWIEE
jgi:tetratricopeptide (TPR) repeat protein